MLKTILFDFDGTIVRSRDIMIRVYNEVAEKHNFKKMEPGEISKLSEMPILERCKYLSVPIPGIPLYVIEGMKKYKKYISEIELVDGIKDVLYKLKEGGFKLSVLSSNSKDTIETILKEKDINVFENIYSSKNIFGKHLKIKAFMKKFGYKNEEIIYIGDEVRDIIACKKIDVKVIGAEWGYDSTVLLKKERPDYLLRRPYEIIEVVSSKNIRGA